MSSDVALHLGEDDVTNADDESDDPDYDSGCNHSCASASADNTDSGSGSDEGGSPSDVDSGHDHIPDPNSSCGTHHGHHHGHGAHTASGNGHATNHSSDHDSDSGSEWGMYGEHEDPDLDTWFGKARSERLCGLSNTAPQAEYALGSDFTSASVPLEACQGRDEKVSNLKASLYQIITEDFECEELASYL